MPEEDTFKEKFDIILAAAARILTNVRRMDEANILVHARITIHQTQWDGMCIWLHLPIDVMTQLKDKAHDIEMCIRDAMYEAASSVIFIEDNNFGLSINLKHDCEGGYTEEWRQEIKSVISGESVTNQGRAHSKNIAAIQHHNLLFRSRAEVNFFDAAVKRGLALAPLPVFVQTDRTQRRTEPDFIIIKDGIFLIVELDGNEFHRETPVAAQERLAFLTQEGAQLYRIESGQCKTMPGAEMCANKVLAYIDKIKSHR
jgi:hypothetical protein